MLTLIFARAVKSFYKSSVVICNEVDAFHQLLSGARRRAARRWRFWMGIRRLSHVSELSMEANRSLYCILESSLTIEDGETILRRLF